MKALIVAPFWRQQGHVGNYRIDRFVRWLAGAGVNVVLIRAGSSDTAKATDWGSEVTVADPLKLYVDSERKDATDVKPRTRSPLRRYLAYLVFNPDPTLVWARRAARHSLIMEQSKGVRWVISSNPPESCHVAAATLARRLNAKLIIDMRDGWLDEPLKPLLRSSWLQRCREGRLESSVLKQASRIFVTSEVWKEMLEARLPFARGKTTVLSNGYPNFVPERKGFQRKDSSRRISLIHSGRFTGSSLSRRAGLLLEPLHKAINQKSWGGEIVLIGSMEERDLEDVNCWKERLSAKNWNIEVKASIPHEALLQTLVEADGLLLLSASRAAIPSKLFEYLAVKRPILAATPRGSAVWRIGERLPQVFLFDYADADARAPIERFLQAIEETVEFSLPEHFAEPYLSRVFLDKVLAA